MKTSRRGERLAGLIAGLQIKLPQSNVAANKTEICVFSPIKPH